MRFSVEINLNERGHHDDGWWRYKLAHCLQTVSNAARKPVGREPIVDDNRCEVGYFEVID
jgi:hypothetical protein